MKRPVRQPLNADQATRWSRNVQIHALDALMGESLWNCRQVAFHGGTSLHLSWQSPRFSEDLDFLLAREVENLDEIMNRVRKAVEEKFLSEDARFVVEMQDKTRDADRMPVYQVGISHPEVMGKTWVKIEFWRVDADYLSRYTTTSRTPMVPGEMVGQLTHQVPAADLESAFCDKLTAFATRPFLKWRDIFDLWWIGTQTQAPLDMATILPRFQHHLSAYNTLDNLPPAEALRRFTERDPADVAAKADPELKRWLPERLWRQLHPEGVREMADYAQQVLTAVATALEAPQDNLPALPRRVSRKGP
jgi:predicted nucleotidyltransferase component of viral defense system